MHMIDQLLSQRFQACLHIDQNDSSYNIEKYLFIPKKTIFHTS